MERTGFLTVEMGSRLRELRLRAGLSRLEVATRMALVGQRGYRKVARLETARARNPTLGTIARFLKACGARWYQFADLLDKQELPEVQVTEAAQKLAGDKGANYAQAEAQAQAEKYQRAQAEFFAHKPQPPQVRAKSAERLMSYRMTENLVQQGVLEVLQQSELSTAAYAFYRAVARHVLGRLWQAVKTSERRQELLAAKDELPDWLGEELAGKQPYWERQQLDLDLVAQVQAVVIRWFQVLLQGNETTEHRVTTENTERNHG